ncbi:IclR family transcriptional regulator [Rhizobium rhizogenes]
MTPKSVSSVRSVERAARIVTTLAEHPYPMGIVELAGRVQLSPGSTHRLMTTLVSLGWIEQNSRTSKYRLGTRMLGIGTTALLTNPAVLEGTAFLARLVEATGHDGQLSTLVGMRVVSLAHVAGPKTLRPELKFEPGLAQPAHASADGKLLLSFLSEAERKYLYEVEGLPAYTANTITDIAELEKEMAEIQAQGYAVDNGERFEDTRGIAAPVLGTDKQPILAVLCIGDVDLSEGSRQTLARYLMLLARELADRLLKIGDSGVAGRSRK